MLRLILLFLLIGYSSSCVSPTKALEKGQYKKAMRLAKSDLKKDKDIDQNILILNEASQIEVNRVLASNESRLSSVEVSDWIKVQNNYFALLENIGEANQITKGQVSGPYDILCEHKTEIDYKIADYYYNEGEDNLAEYYSTKEKLAARKAYTSYKNALEYGVAKYYSDTNEKMESCIELGRVYYVASDYSPVNTLFFRPVPRNSEEEADCIIDVSRSGYSSSESRSTSQKTYKEEVEIGKESIVDTSGNVTYKPIYQTVSAYEDITEITKTLNTTTYVNVRNQTGQCHIKSWSFSNEVSDAYEEIIFSGDTRAYPIGAKNETGPPAFFISNLEDELKRAVNRKL